MAKNRRPPPKTRRPARPVAKQSQTTTPRAAPVQSAAAADAPPQPKPTSPPDQDGAPAQRVGATTASARAPRTPAARASAPPPRSKAPSRPGPRRPPPRKKSSRMGWIYALVAMLVVGGVVAAVVIRNGSSGTSGPTGGPEGIPVPAGTPLAGVNTAQYGQPIDGISCLGSEQLAYHIHAHLAIFVNGVQKQVPYGVGIAPPLQTAQAAGSTFVEGGGCFYWLHTHAADGVIHIESPTETVYTLGQFFDVWGQPLASAQVGPAHGPVIAYLNGKQYNAPLQSIRLDAHNDIQLDVGTPVVPPQTVNWSGTGL